MSELEAQLVAVLSSAPGLSAREISARLRQAGMAVHKSDLNPVLYREARFEHDHGRVPRWRLRGTASTQSAGPFSRTARATERRSQRQALDRRQDAVAALRVGLPGTAEPDDAVEQALALLRSRGFTVDEPSSPGRGRAAAPEGRTAAFVRAVPGAIDSAGAGRQSPRLAATTPQQWQGPLPVPAWELRLRRWQEQALTAWYDAGGVGICEAVTGTGKTHLGLEAVAQWVRRGERATVLVPSVLLQRQWEQRIEQFVPEAVVAKVGGVRRGDATRADVVIAVINSAIRSDLTSLGADMSLLVADEVHRYGGEGWSNALRAGYRYRLGLTATLERGSDEGVAELLLPYFRSIVHRYTYDRAVPEGVVAPFDLVFLGIGLDDEERALYENLSRKLSNARKTLLRAGATPQTLHQQLGRLRALGGEVRAAVQVYEAASRDRRRLLADMSGKQDALRDLAEVVGESHGSVLFTQSKETASAAAAILGDCGLSAAAVFSDGMAPERRQELIDQLDEGTLDALAAPRILDEGVDIPDIDLGIVLGASSSRRQMIQRLGRVIRLKPDGRRARFVIMYALDSVEDPESGGRDEFMDEVEKAASAVTLFREWDESTIDEIWSGQAPAWERDRPAAVVAEAAVGLSTLVSNVAPAPDQGPAVTQGSDLVPRTPVRRVSRPLPAPRRPDRPDAAVTANLLQRIDETLALAEWIRSEHDQAGAG